MPQRPRDIRLPTASSGMLAFADALGDVGMQISQDNYASDMLQSTLNNMQVEKAIDKELFDNRDNPDAARKGIEKILTEHNKTMLRNVTHGRAKREIRSKAPLLTAAWMSSAKKKINAQNVSNNITALKTIAKTVQNTDYDPTSLAAAMLDVFGSLDAAGKAAGMNDEQIANAYDEIASSATSKTLLYSPDLPETNNKGEPADREYWINNPNEFADTLGLNSKIGRPLYTAPEAAKLKSKYESAKKDAQSQITAEQKANAEAVELEITNDIQKSVDPKVPPGGKLTFNQIREKIRKANEEGIFIDAAQPRVLDNYLDSKTNDRDENESNALSEAYKMMTTDMTQQQKFNKLMSLSSKLESNTVDSFVKDIYKPDTVSNATYKAYSSAIGNLKTGKMFSREATKNINLSLKAQDLLRKFAEENPDATGTEYEKFFNRLIENQTSFWGGIFTGKSFWQSFRREKGELRYSIPRNIEALEKDLSIKESTKQYKSGDKRTVNGVTYTYDGQYWTD